MSEISKERIERAAEEADTFLLREYQKHTLWNDAKDVIEELDRDALVSAFLLADSPEIAAAEGRGRVEGLEMAAKIVDPGCAAPCLCNTCDCGNVDDAQSKAIWECGTEDAKRIRSRIAELREQEKGNV